MRALAESLPAELTVREALQRAHSIKFRSWLVMESSGVIGVINRLTLEREFTQDANQQLGKIVSTLNFPHVHSDQSLDLALERMGANQLDVLPVVSRANVHELEGIVTLGDVLDSYGVSPPARD
jgi:CIC family chloride channel protein